jgi:alpha-beta hydrolase superfamily lysophospholipase
MIQPQGFPSLPDDWRTESQSFPASCNQQQLFMARHYKEGGENSRALFIVHGLGEHGGRYLHFPHYLKDFVDSIYCLDLRGHGRSEGTRGHVDSFDQYVEDAYVASKRVKERELHWLGHSMGGLISLRLLLKHPEFPLKSATVSAPLLGVSMEVPPLKKLAAHLISKVWGSLQLKNEVDPTKLSHDSNVVQAYRDDRLVHDKITPSLFIDMMATMEDTFATNRGISVPLQFIVPSDDKIVDSERTESFYRKLNLKDKIFFPYAGFFHESFNELEKEKPLGDLAKWIQKWTDEKN